MPSSSLCLMKMLRKSTAEYVLLCIPHILSIKNSMNCKFLFCCPQGISGVPERYRSKKGLPLMQPDGRQLAFLLHRESPFRKAIA